MVEGSANPETCLQKIAAEDRADVARFLLENGARADIFSLVSMDDVDTIETMLAADITLVHGRTHVVGANPLHKAKSIPMVRLLLAHGADIDALESGHQRTPLDMTLHVPELGELGQFLVDQGAAIGFHTLCILGFLEQVDAAIEAGPQTVDQPGEYPALQAGYASLHFAVFGRRAEVIERLVAAGADLETRSGILNKTALE